MCCLKGSLSLINRTKESTHVTWGWGKGGSSFGFGVVMRSKEQWHCCSKWSLSVISWWHINVGPIGLCPSDELSWENDSHQTCPFGFTFGIMIYAARCPRHELEFCLSAVCLSLPSLPAWTLLTPSMWSATWIVHFLRERQYKLFDCDELRQNECLENSELQNKCPQLDVNLIACVYPFGRAVCFLRGLGSA